MQTEADTPAVERGEDRRRPADPPTIDRLTRIYLKIRDARSALTAVYDEQEAALKVQMDEVAGAIKDQMQTLGVKTARTDFGTVSLSTKTRYWASDWDMMGRFIIDNDAVFLLEKRIAQTNMSTFLEENPGVVPPGLNTLSEVAVSVRRPSKT